MEQSIPSVAVTLTNCVDIATRSTVAIPFLPLMKAHQSFILKTYSWCPTLQQAWQEIQDNWKCHPNSVRKNGDFGFGPIRGVLSSIGNCYQAHEKYGPERHKRVTQHWDHFGPRDFGRRFYNWRNQIVWRYTINSKDYWGLPC